MLTRAGAGRSADLTRTDVRAVPIVADYLPCAVASSAAGSATPTAVVQARLDPVEGNVNRIKTIKRQMYGRANLDLLRKRVVAAP